MSRAYMGQKETDSDSKVTHPYTRSLFRHETYCGIAQKRYNLYAMLEAHRGVHVMLRSRVIYGPIARACQ